MRAMLACAALALAVALVGCSRSSCSPGRACASTSCPIAPASRYFDWARTTPALPRRWCSRSSRSPFPACARRGIAMPIVALVIGWRSLSPCRSSSPPGARRAADQRHQHRYANPPQLHDHGASLSGRRVRAPAARRLSGHRCRSSLPMPPREAFERAVAAAEAMGWEVVGRDAAARHARGGRHAPSGSASRTTSPIRVRAAERGSRI